MDDLFIALFAGLFCSGQQRQYSFLVVQYQTLSGRADGETSPTLGQWH